MPEEDRICTFLMDEMSLKRGIQYDPREDALICTVWDHDLSTAGTAMVFMVRCLRARWRQAVAFFFVNTAVTGEKLLEKMMTCLGKLKECGLKLAAVTSDQGSNLTYLTNVLKITPEEPYFALQDNDGVAHEIAMLPDYPHLLKSVRNALLNHTILTSKGLASWSHIADLYNLDSAGSIRLCPRLTPQHIAPPPIYGKMRVKLAAQVFSHSVTAAIHTYVTRGQLPSTHLVTASLCSFMNGVFDLMNSSKPVDVVPGRRGLTREKAAAFIPGAIAELSSWKVFDQKQKDVTRNFQCFTGWRTALSAARYLAFQLNFKYLLTRNLCQDSLENLFGLLRQKNGFNVNPTGISSCLQNLYM